MSPGNPLLSRSVATALSDWIPKIFDPGSRSNVLLPIPRELAKVTATQLWTWVRGRFASPVLNPRPEPKPQAAGKQIRVIDVIIGARGGAFSEIRTPVGGHSPRR